MAVFILIALSLALQTPSPIVPAPTTLPPVSIVGQAPVVPDQPQQRIVCQSEAVVGTNRRKRVCMTVTERTERRDAGRSASDRLDRQLAKGAGGNGQGSTDLPGRGF